MIAKLLVTACFLALLGASTSTPLFPDFSTYFPWKVGSCEKNGYTYMKELDVEKFFNGSWYEAISYGTFLFQMDGNCPTFKSKVSGNDVNFLFYQYQDLLSKWVVLRGRSEVDKMKGSKFTVQYDFVAGLTNVKVPYSVMATDYENYAVFYSCQEALGFKLEMAWASTRERGDKTFLPQMKQAIEDAGLPMSEFVENNSKGCGAQEPNL